jgi:hypothetical protein
MGEPMGRKKIEDIEFTLFYDYDQLENQNLSKLTPDGKIEWFQYRMEVVFLSPIRKLFDRQSDVHKQLNSSPYSEWPWNAFITAAFSILLNGVEALGSFLPYSKKFVNESKRNRSKNYYRFREFICKYMGDWNTNITGTSYKSSYLPEILWDHFRNGIAHAFVIEGGGIEYDTDPTNKWKIKWGRYLEIEPIRFFEDFLKGLNSFFKDVKGNQRMYFLNRFKETYPH